jgi:hypothetical protein
LASVGDACSEASSRVAYSPFETEVDLIESDAKKFLSSQEPSVIDKMMEVLTEFLLESCRGSGNDLLDVGRGRREALMLPKKEEPRRY